MVKWHKRGGHHMHGFGHGMPPFGPQWGHQWGHHSRHVPWDDTSSSSSSESDSCGQRKKMKKIAKKHMKRWNKYNAMHGSDGLERDRGIAVCGLCCHRIKPLVENEVLECGHIYHRLCLKQLMTLSIVGEQNQVFCSQCKRQVSDQLVQEFGNRFGEREVVADNRTQHVGQQPMNFEA